MKAYSFLHKKKSGWGREVFPSVDESRSIIFIFASRSLADRPKPLKELLNQYSRCPFIGCSSAGEIFDSQVGDNTVSVAVVEFDNASARVVAESINSAEQSFNVGKNLALRLLQNGIPTGVFVLSDGLNVNGSALARGMNSVLPPNVIVTGGLAGDGDRFQSTWTLDRNGCKSHQIVAAGFYGESIVYSHGSRGGWDIFGPERIATKSNGNVLYTIDNEPALDLYERYLGDQASKLPASGLLFPLQVWVSSNPQKKLVRTLLSIDRANRSLTYAGDVVEGSTIQLMHANFDHLIEGASEAASLASLKKCPKGSDFLSLAISCVGRRLILGERIEEEVEAALGSLPKNTKQIGFYSYGELSPYVLGEPCELHNQTMTITAIGEKKLA